MSIDLKSTLNISLENIFLYILADQTFQMLFKA